MKVYKIKSLLLLLLIGYGLFQNDVKFRYSFARYWRKRF